MLSKTMKAALEYARSHGGYIDRYPGGYWGFIGPDSFGTTTIQALVSRGMMEYSVWHEGSTRFPIKVKLVASREAGAE